MTEEEVIWRAAKRYFNCDPSESKAEYLCDFIWGALASLEKQLAERDDG